jgi:hypothetical protein
VGSSVSVAKPVQATGFTNTCTPSVIRSTGSLVPLPLSWAAKIPGLPTRAGFSADVTAASVGVRHGLPHLPSGTILKSSCFAAAYMVSSPPGERAGGRGAPAQPKALRATSWSMGLVQLGRVT